MITKLVFRISLIAFGLVLFMSCGSSRNVSTTDPGGNRLGVQMQVTPERNGGAPETLQLMVRNNTQEIIQFGAGYSIERRAGNGWVGVDLGNFAVIAIMYMLQPGESGEYAINLFTDRVTYPEGEYRVVKQIAVGERDMQAYYANFRIIEPR